MRQRIYIEAPNIRGVHMITRYLEYFMKEELIEIYENMEKYSESNIAYSVRLIVIF